MDISTLINDNNTSRHFSFEVLPPLKGNGTGFLFSTIDKLKDFNPLYINITTHYSEYVYRELENGQFERLRIRRRPGTIAIAAAIQNKYNIPVIPHIICSGATKEDIEYELLDLQFLGIENLLLLRGDKAKEDSMFKATPGGHEHTTQLIEQVNQFNNGLFVDGTPIKNPGKPFHFGVAAYPEKHEEAPNLEMDMAYLKMKQDLGAEAKPTWNETPSPPSVEAKKKRAAPHTTCNAMPTTHSLLCSMRLRKAKMAIRHTGQESRSTTKSGHTAKFLLPSCSIHRLNTVLSVPMPCCTKVPTGMHRQQMVATRARNRKTVCLR